MERYILHYRDSNELRMEMMRTFTTTILLGLLILPVTQRAADTAAVANALRLRSGTPVLLRLTNALSSSEAQVNDRVEFRVVNDVRVGTTSVITKDSVAWGVVREASPRARMARAGKLSIDIQSACMADGHPAPLRAVERSGDPAVKSSRGSGVGDTLLAFPAWPVMLFLFGKDRKIEAGAEVTVYIDRDLTIDPALLNANSARGNCAGAPQPAVLSADACTAMVRSDPEGAEIQVDGKYVGNTPSRLRLAPGDHEVAVSSQGRRVWRRTITATAGAEISISAVLPAEEAAPGSRADAGAWARPRDSRLPMWY